MNMKIEIGRKYRYIGENGYDFKIISDLNTKVRILAEFQIFQVSKREITDGLKNGSVLDLGK